MSRTPVSLDIRGQMIFLGTGTSVGVPTIGCGCPVCVGNDPLNQRTRCSVIFGLPEGNLLIDTPPDLRAQLLRERIGIVHAVAYTHEHADHIFGMDELRIFQFYLSHPVPIYCRDIVETSLRRCFSYAFTNLEPTHTGAVPQLEFRRITDQPFTVLGTTVIPIPLKHGPRFEVLGFRIGDIAYCTDTNEIPETSLPLLEGLEVLILDALRPMPHATHFSLEEAIAAAQRLRPKQTYFTHISCKLDHRATNAQLPPNMRLAHDGLRIDI